MMKRLYSVSGEIGLGFGIQGTVEAFSVEDAYQQTMRCVHPSIVAYIGRQRLVIQPVNGMLGDPVDQPTRVTRRLGR